MEYEITGLKGAVSMEFWFPVAGEREETPLKGYKRQKDRQKG